MEAFSTSSGRLLACISRLSPTIVDGCSLGSANGDDVLSLPTLPSKQLMGNDDGHHYILQVTSMVHSIFRRSVERGLTCRNRQARCSLISPKNVQYTRRYSDAGYPLKCWCDYLLRKSLPGCVPMLVKKKEFSSFHHSSVKMIYSMKYRSFMV